MLTLKVLTHPLNKMVFEHAFDKLVKEVQGYQPVDICTGEILSEWLGAVRCQFMCTGQEGGEGGLTVTLSTTPYVSQSVFGLNASLHTWVCSSNRKSGSISSRFSGDDAQLCGWVNTGHLLSTET